jgi:hypothetical protein
VAVVVFPAQDRFVDRGWGWWFFGGIVPIMLLIAMPALVVWAMLRLNRSSSAPAPPPPKNPALEALGRHGPPPGGVPGRP